MQKPGVLLAFIVVSFPCFGQGTLEVTITGFREMRGEVMVGLTTQPGDFPKEVSRGKVCDVSGEVVTVTFHGLSAGVYAISVFHDSNRNGELDSSWLGVPKEGFAFGNNAMGVFGPPAFEKASVGIHGDTVVRQALRLRYF